MLKQLVIKNFILIKNACLDFSQGFNVITGETGAGKSILLNALGITLGNKIDLSIISPGEDKIEVISTFDIHNNIPLKKKYSHLGLGEDPEQELILKREITKDGKSRCLINGNPANLSLLKEISEKLIDIHSQYQNQYLFNSDHHLYFFDQTLNLKEVLIQYKKKFFHLQQLRKQFTQIEKEGDQLLEEKEFLLYSIKEFEGKFLEEKKYRELKTRLQEIENLEKSQQALTLFKENILQGLSELEKAAMSLKEISLPEKTQLQTQELPVLIDQVRDLTENILADSGFKENHRYLHEIDDLNQKLSGTEKLLRKYNTDHHTLYSKYENLKKKLDRLEDIEFDKKKILTGLKTEEKACWEAALVLHHKRKNGVPPFEEKINEQIKDLAIKNAAFKLNLTPLTDNPEMDLQLFNERGINKLEFLFSPGKEMEPKPLKKIASGGELSRIMLAIKYLLNQSLPNETIVFDEIDTGVGGIAAVKTGKKIKEISSNKQVIVITHLPQIAKYADRHFRIEKKIDSMGKTQTAIQFLQDKEILAELTRMMGKEISEENLKLTEKIIYGK